jgi:hypothetical protein
MEQTALRDFLEIPYDKLEELNLEVKDARMRRVSPDKLEEQRIKYLTDEKRLKAVTVCFSDLEGRLHMLDYDKKFLLKSVDNLTFDGSSIRGFSAQQESDLRLHVDWPAFYWLPADVFGPGKVLVFADVRSRDGEPYPADLRSRLKAYTDQIFGKDGTVCHAANEVEGFLFQGRDAERRYHETGKFEFNSTGGYYHSLPGDSLRRFIDSAAEVQRAMGFENEKDHPEVALAAGQQSQPGVAARQQPIERLDVLPGEHFGRRHQDHLGLVCHGQQHRVDGHDRLAAADVPLQQPVHRMRASHVGGDFGHGLVLASGQFEAEQAADPGVDLGRQLQGKGPHRVVHPAAFQRQRQLQHE